MNWKEIIVSDDLTHHIFNNSPLYTNRFDKVLKFHNLGLAPVEKNRKAWHIKIDGTEAYSKRFKKTFGFYERFASVLDESGAYHINIDGENFYKERYAWTGNFQEGKCSVRRKDGSYIHITKTGKELTKKSWRYVGDFKDGVAVVQNKDGYSTHIDGCGQFIHNNWFHDLDIYHKGFARAKDHKGWTHIDILGNPVYSERYVMVEPFYNGQARVETFAGALKIIDENGQQIHELRQERDGFHELSSDLVGFWRTHTIANAVELGIFEHLPSTLKQLSRILKLPENKLRRILRALWELNICVNNKGKWELTDKGKYLQKKSFYSLASASKEYLHRLEPKWRSLKKAMTHREWKPEKDIFYEVLEKQEYKETHHNMLSAYAKYDYEKLISILPIENGQTILDLGGSLGVLAKMLKVQYNKSEIIVLDLLEADEDLKVKGILYKTGDFFKPWDIKADIIIMSRILHDWNDKDALKILCQAKKHINKGGKLLIIEMLLDENNPNGSLCDLHLLTVTGGQERTIQEYDLLLNKAGFLRSRLINSTSFLSIIEVTANE